MYSFYIQKKVTSRTINLGAQMSSWEVLSSLRAKVCRFRCVLTCIRLAEMLVVATFVFTNDNTSTALNG